MSDANNHNHGNEIIEKLDIKAADEAEEEGPPGRRSTDGTSRSDRRCMR